MWVKIRRWFKGLCTDCGRRKGHWRMGEDTCYHCDLVWQSEEQRQNMFRHMGWDKKYPVIDKAKK